MENTEKTNNNTLSPHLRIILDSMIGNMRFYAIFSIVYGILSCITIVGAIFGIPIILTGIHLREAAEHYKRYTNLNDENQLFLAFERQNKFFYLYKIIAIITIVLFALYIIFIVFLIIAAILGNGELFEVLKDLDYSSL